MKSEVGTSGLAVGAAACSCRQRNDLQQFISGHMSRDEAGATGLGVDDGDRGTPLSQLMASFEGDHVAYCDAVAGEAAAVDGTPLGESSDTDQTTYNTVIGVDSDPRSVYSLRGRGAGVAVLTTIGEQVVLSPVPPPGPRSQRGHRPTALDTHSQLTVVTAPYDDDEDEADATDDDGDSTCSDTDATETAYDFGVMHDVAATTIPVSEWRRGGMLGTGSFGSVYKGLKTTTGMRPYLYELLDTPCVVHCYPGFDVFSR